MQQGKSKLVWLHAASVGESMIAITMVESLSKAQENLEFLITTGTISSANMLRQWAKNWPDNNIYHQFMPIDNSLIAYIFCNYWKPSIVLFIESEIWPNLIYQASKICPSLIINARLSHKSFQRWSKYKLVFQSIMSNYSKIIAQDEANKQKFIQLGMSNTINLGNLKFSNKELDINEEKLEKLQQRFSNHKIFVAASTHAEDEDVVLASIKKLYDKGIKFLSIIVLRHPDRKTELIKLCKYHNLKYLIRSEEDSSDYMNKMVDNELYIVDSFGELGLFYKLADIVIVGGSFKRGGHNLLEPAYFDCAIIVGPDMSHHQEIVDDMIKQSAACRISNEQELENAIAMLLNDDNYAEQKRKKLSDNARTYVMDRKKIVGDYVVEIKKYLS